MCILGVQDIINAYVHARPEFVMELPCSRNFHRNQFEYHENQCTVALSSDIFLLHGGMCIYFNSKYPPFRLVYESFHALDLATSSFEDLVGELKRALGILPKVNCNIHPSTFAMSLEAIVSNRTR